eukprot:GEMP01070656.1.p1 GENE.GEMP01070656.1~~GEMP01070656.1.p1  ORF type:complete len:343 (+),score=45.07 GEMP01070656.1:25-1029(+)
MDQNGSGDSSIAQACLVASTLSIIGCVLIIALFLRFTKLRKHFARLVVYMTISDFWFCLANTFGPFDTYETGCFVQAMFTTYFGMASILWTGSIAYSLQFIVENCHGFNEREIEPMLMKICWGVPAIFTVLTMTVVGFEPAGYWCWIDDSALGEIFRLIDFYIPLWFTISYSLWIYQRLRKRITQLIATQTFSTDDTEVAPIDGSSNLKDHQRALLRILLFPMVLVFCWTAGTINRLISFFVPNFSWPLLSYIVVVTGSLQGFLNACLYGSTVAVREEMVDLIHDFIIRMRRDAKKWRRRKPMHMRKFRREKMPHEDIIPLQPSTIGRPSEEAL